MFSRKVPFGTRERLKNSDLRNCFISFARHKDEVALFHSRAESFLAKDGIDIVDISLSRVLFVQIVATVNPSSTAALVG